MLLLLLLARHRGDVLRLRCGSVLKRPGVVWRCCFGLWRLLLGVGVAL